MPPADEDDHRRHALCLQILVNAVQIWNARYMTAAIDHLHAARPDVVADHRALAGVAPVTHAHINSFGRYDLNRQPPPPGQLRPLRPGLSSLLCQGEVAICGVQPSRASG